MLRPIKETEKEQEMDKKLAELFENPLFSVFGGGIQFSILRRGPKQRNLELDSSLKRASSAASLSTNPFVEEK